jgi:hypothetical protein
LQGKTKKRKNRVVRPRLKWSKVSGLLAART